MPLVISAEALADPIGVIVTQVAARDPSLDHAVITKVVEEVTGGRAKRRRLAQALLDNPGVLADGRSPAPRAVADLLIALRNAGAAAIAAPACAECGKQLRTFQRRGEDWYCGICGPVREPCEACGHLRRVHSRDRDGKPRCSQCPPTAGSDPVSAIVQVVASIDSSIPPALVAQAVRSAVPRAGQRQPLAWVLQDRPGLLTGAGAQAPIPAVLRLIDRLCDAGTQTVVHPACPRCGRVLHLNRRIGGQWCCRNCVARSGFQPCARCGSVQQVAIRDEHGQPLCPHCLVTDPANLETCATCGRVRPVSARTPGGPLCSACLPAKTMTCAICGRHTACYLSRTTGQPWCEACKQRWARCSRCGQMARARGGTKAEPLCGACTRPDPGFWRTCPGCGQTGRITGGRCIRCTTRKRLRELLGDQAGVIRPGLQQLYNALADAERPATVEAWLNKSAAPAILRQLAGKQLTHHVLDELGGDKTAEHLRAVLVAIGTLPERDEQMSRLERWISHIIGEQPDPGRQQLMHRYAVWHVTRRLRGRLHGSRATHQQVVAAQRNIRAADALLDWLTVRDLTLATARQGDLEEWLGCAQASHRTDAGNFVRWARRNKLTRLDYAATRWGGPSGVIDTEARWDQARRLLHDDTIKPEDRIAGLLVLLYAQTATSVSQLTLDHIEHDSGEVRLQLGREPLTLPPPVDKLILQLAATRRGHAAIGDQGTSPWLFPGGQPGRPISAYRLAERLRQLGILPGRARSAALFQLATDLPAAVLARMLGIHIAVAVTWQRAAAGDWTAYAADISRRAQSAHRQGGADQIRT